MAGGDCLLWIDGDYQSVERFVVEAEQRGCCRKVATWPAWVSRGSRVFLAHRHENVRTDTGSIFGYFPLHGVDVILDSQSHDKYKNLRTTFRTRRDDPEPLLEFWRDQFRGRGLPIDTRRRSHDEDTRPRPHDEHVVDFLIDLVFDCEDDGDDGFGRGIPTDQTDLEADRDCGSRPSGWDRDDDVERGNPCPAIYLVDSLAREIEDVFCEILKELLKDERKKRRRKSETAELKTRVRKEGERRLGIPEFDEAVTEAARVTIRPSVPRGLSGHAHTCGSMVVFEEPYPSFRRLPQASFRGLLRVDGDQLMKEIVAAYRRSSRDRTVLLPYYRGEIPVEGKRTKRDLVADLAIERQATKQVVEDFWGSFVDMITRELVERGRVTITDVGTLSVRDWRGEREIKFRPSTVLSRKLES
jgi:nucleoid DNA-binding protein